MTGGFTIRPAFPDDAAALARLAALDSQPLPSGRLLLAEVHGEIWAALSLEHATAIADPFRQTAAVVELLRARARQVAPAHRRRLVPRFA
jgi:hypothetical protein